MFFILTICVVTLVGAFVVNLLVGLLRSEHPRDTGRLWADMFLRVLVVMRLGALGHILNHVGSNGWWQRILYVLGVVFLLGILLSTCND